MEFPLEQNIVFLVDLYQTPKIVTRVLPLYIPLVPHRHSSQLHPAPLIAQAPQRSTITFSACGHRQTKAQRLLGQITGHVTEDHVLR